MKTKSSLFNALLLVLAVPAGRLIAAPLAETTAVHTQPDPASPAITYLKAGTDPAPVANAVASTPAGWLALELPGPFEGYVENKDLTKNLEVRPGAPIRLAPKAEAGILVAAEKGDKTTITGLRGRWTQVSLEKKLTGYIHLGGTNGYVPPVATTPAGVAPAMAPAPVAPTAYGTAEAGRPAPMVDLGDGGGAALPRQFAGRFVSTRRPLTPRRPYDYALNDDAGKRYAYVDVSKLLMTDQIEKYLNHSVVVFGTAKTTVSGREFVIEVESLQLR
jgi:hypothetical protein